MKTRIALWMGVVLLFWAHALADATLDPTTLLVQKAASQLALDPTHVAVTVMEAPGLLGSLADYRFEFGAVPRGRTVVRAQSAMHPAVSFTVDVRVWDSAWVALTTVERAVPLSESQFSKSWQDITEHSVVTEASLDGLRAKRRLSAGAVLLTDAVEPLPLVERGHAVTVSAKTGHLVVSRPGVALSDAQRGEPVRVRVDANVIITATATGPNLCAVNF